MTMEGAPMAIIASRMLKCSDSSTVEVHIHAPVEVAVQEWACKFQVGEHAQDAFGLDGLQALLMALDGVRAHLSQIPPTTWQGGEPGDHGVPRMISQAFGLAFSRHMDAIIDKELETLVK
jgi:hypothetical protein